MNQESRKIGKSRKKVRRCPFCPLAAKAFNRQRSRREIEKQTVFKAGRFEVASSYDLLHDFRISETFSCLPAFLIHNLNRSLCSGFFPAGVVRHGDRGN
jgi:hypothetical protein